MDKNRLKIIKDTEDRLKLYKDFYTKKEINERLKDAESRVDIIHEMQFRAIEEVVFYKALLTIANR